MLFTIVNGQYTHWSEWSKCDQDCGLGNQTRSRNCTDPEPANGGKPCIGKAMDYMTCKIKDCAGNLTFLKKQLYQ